MAKGLKKECLDSVSQVIGRQLTAKEGEDIVLNIKSKVLDIRKTEPNLTKDQYVAKAAALVYSRTYKASIVLCFLYGRVAHKFSVESVHDRVTAGQDQHA